MSEQNEIKGMTPSEYAKDRNYDPKSVRRVMRSMIANPDDRPGSGGRWEMDADFVAALDERMKRSHNKKVVIASIDKIK